MTFKDYQNLTNRAIPSHVDSKDAILHWCIGLSEECGEVMSVIKHHFYGGENFNREDLVKEIGDVLWYLTALCRDTGINIEAVAQLNAEKLIHRFPNEFDIERSGNRHDLEKKFSETEIYSELMEKALGGKS